MSGIASPSHQSGTRKGLGLGHHSSLDGTDDEHHKAAHGVVTARIARSSAPIASTTNVPH